MTYNSVYTCNECGAETNSVAIMDLTWWGVHRGAKVNKHFCSTNCLIAYFQQEREKELNES